MMVMKTLILILKLIIIYILKGYLYINFLRNILKIGAENLYKEKIDSPFIKEINCVIYLEDGKFAASSSNMILVFDLENNKVN